MELEQEERENLASACHVSVEQIIEWESSEYNWARAVKIDVAFIDAQPVEPYEEFHSFELGRAA